MTSPESFLIYFNFFRIAYQNSEKSRFIFFLKTLTITRKTIVMITGMTTAMIERIGLANKTLTSFIKPVIVNSLPNVPKNPNWGISIYIIMQNAIIEVIKKAL